MKPKGDKTQVQTLYNANSSLYGEQICSQMRNTAISIIIFMFWIVSTSRYTNVMLEIAPEAASFQDSGTKVAEYTTVCGTIKQIHIHYIVHYSFVESAHFCGTCINFAEPTNINSFQIRKCKIRFFLWNPLTVCITRIYI